MYRRITLKDQMGTMTFVRSCHVSLFPKRALPVGSTCISKSTVIKDPSEAALVWKIYDASSLARHFLPAIRTGMIVDWISSEVHPTVELSAGNLSYPRKMRTTPFRLSKWQPFSDLDCFLQRKLVDGIDVNQRNIELQSPLHPAARGDSVESKKCPLYHVYEINVLS